MKAVAVDTVRILIPWVAVQHGKDAYGLADQPAGVHPAADVGQRRKEDLGH
jgi:hypothetical protein